MINVTTDHIITSNLTKSSLMIHVVGITNRFITLRNKLVNNPGVSNSLCHTKASYNIRKKDGLIYKKFYTGLIYLFKSIMSKLKYIQLFRNFTKKANFVSTSRPNSGIFFIQRFSCRPSKKYQKNEEYL